ncbi:MAG TPA: NTP transferase domain-containing protein, partial [Firmicutes bacterium]|nr:NTP transferase domain-containing protein [Bacillota bacterium]
MPSVTAIIPAAGKSVRMAGVSKQYAQLHGLPVLAHTLRIFQAMPEIERVVLVVREKDIDYCRDKIVAALGFDKVKAVLAGGAHRQESVRRGLLAA